MYNLNEEDLDYKMTSIDVKAFDEAGNIIYNPYPEDTIYANSEVYYIGIALREDIEEGLEDVIISYGGNEVTRLEIVQIGNN